MSLDTNSVTTDDLFEIPGEESISSWEDISRVLNRIQRIQHDPLPASKTDFLELASRGTAFLTFDFGIDGVSIEISKYTRALEEIYLPFAGDRLHLIAGDFNSRADKIIRDHWSHYRIDGINGWQKWEGGQWFDALYFDDMPAGSQRSSELAKEIYRQAITISRALGRYLIANEIALLIPVNVASNPGNLALALALVIVTETLGTVVINSNHDFYWDGGKAAAERGPDEEPGNRDHFFRNFDNKPFFSLFKRLYPWNGRRWLQVNINATQSEKLVREYGFPEGRVYEITTSVSDKLLEDYTNEDVKSARLRMAHILSGGQAQILPITLESYKEGLHKWMQDQSPRVIGARGDLNLDLTAPGIFYLLQTTRVIARKRIEKGVELILALLQGPMRSTFEDNKDRQLVLHVTGPTPLEHQADLETILHAYGKLIDELPSAVAERVFLAFSVGHETHPSFDEPDFDDLNIADIYRLSTVILFPSEIEGRGLPIIESAAVGKIIICSRFRPTDVFADVIGEDLPEEQRIRYLHFPEGDFSEDFLDQVNELLLYPEENIKWRNHNRQVIRLRYSKAALRMAFQRLIETAYEIAD